MGHWKSANSLSTKTRFLTMSSAAAMIAASIMIATPSHADDATAQKNIEVMGMKYAQ